MKAARLTSKAAISAFPLCNNPYSADSSINLGSGYLAHVSNFHMLEQYKVVVCLVTHGI